MLFALVVLSSISLVDNDPNLTFEVLGQPDVDTNLRPSDPVETLETIGSPSNLMDSVLDEVRSTDTSKMNVKEDEEYSYSTGENILLSHQIVPAKDFIHLYDTHPFAIAEGFISTKLPCDSDNSTQLRIMIGQIPKLYPVNLSMEKGLSKPGYMCLFNFEIQQNSTSNRNTLPITDIVLFNGSSERTVLPNTSTFVIGVTKLYPLQNITIRGP